MQARGLKPCASVDSETLAGVGVNSKEMREEESPILQVSVGHLYFRVNTKLSHRGLLAKRQSVAKINYTQTHSHRLAPVTVEATKPRRSRSSIFLLTIKKRSRIGIGACSAKDNRD
jgi:hypothetical protein